MPPPGQFADKFTIPVLAAISEAVRGLCKCHGRGKIQAPIQEGFGTLSGRFRTRRV